MTSTPERLSVPDASAYRAAVRRLATAQKPGHGVPAWTRWPNRAAGRRLAALAFLAGASPNQVTLVSGFASLLSVLVLLAAPPSPVSALVVAGLLLLGYALDSADGQLARLQGGGSLTGEWLDHVVDAVRLPLVHAAVAVALVRWGDGVPSWAPLVALGFVVVASTRFFVMMLTEQVLARAGDGVLRSERAVPSATTGRLRSWVLLPLDFGTLALVFLLWASPPAFLWAYGALFALNAAWLAPTLLRRYREVAAVAAAATRGAVA